MSSSWIEALVTINEDIIGCERRLNSQWARVVPMGTEGQDTSADEMLLLSYHASLTLIRVYTDHLLQDARAVA